MVHYMQYLIEGHTLRLSVVGGAGEGKIQIHTLRLSVVGGAGGGKNSNTYSQ